MINRKIGNDAAILSLSKVAIMVIALLSNMLLSRFRTVEEYGIYSQLMIIITLAVSFFTLGFPSSANYFLALYDEREARHNFLSTYFSLNTVLCIIIGIVLSICVPIFENYFSNPHLRKFIYFLALYPWANVTISGISNILVVYGRIKILAYVNILTALVTLFSVVFVEVGEMNFDDFLQIFLFGNLFISLFIYFYVNRLEGKLKICFDKKLLKDIFKYSIPLGLATLVGTINIEMDKLMIGNMMDTESLAYYANAGRELPLTFISVSLTTVLMPQMVKYLKESRYDDAVLLWGKAIILSFIILSLCVTICIVFAPQIITVLYSDKYLPGVQVFRIYSLILLLRLTYWGMILNSLGKTKFIFISSIISLLLNILFNYLFFIYWGFEGPAIASFISILLVNLVQLVFTSYLIKIPFNKIFPWKCLAKILSINIFIGGVCFLFVNKYSTTISDIIKSVIIGLLFGIIYLFLLKNQIKTLWNNLNNN